MTQTTANTISFLHPEQYSDIILTTHETEGLGEMFYRDVSGFDKGETLHIKTIGKATLQEVEEGRPMVYNPIETGEITLSITDYKGDAWAVSDKLMRDAYQIPALMVQRSLEAGKALNKDMDTRFLQTAANVYSGTSEPFKINEKTRKVITNATLADAVITSADLHKMSLAFDVADIPRANRVAIITPESAYQLKKAVTLTSDISPQAMEILRGNMTEGMAVIGNYWGWNVIQSNLLPTETNPSDGTTTLSGVGQHNLFMALGDDNSKPVMRAMRVMPSLVSYRREEERETAFHTITEYGFGVQRTDSLATIITGAGVTKD